MHTPIRTEPSLPTIGSKVPPSHLIEEPRERLDFAKWPPDDDGPGGGMPGSPYNMGGGSDDGNFRKGATKPIAIAVALLVLAGGAGLAFFGAKTEAAHMSKEEVNKERLAIQLMPKEERLAKNRAWAANEIETRLQQDAFIQLAWAKDTASIPLITKGLTSIDHGVRATAASALADFGSPAADSAKPALEKALTEADASDKPQIAWALAALHDTAAFDGVLAEYKTGHLGSVLRLDGYAAFDPEVFAGMVSLDKLATLASDENEAVRQLVASTLSRTGDAKWTQTLIKLVQDSSVDVARQAAVGLGKIANEEAMTPLVAALSKADKESREKFLQALRDGIGGRGLVLALDTVSHAKVDTEKFQTKVIFDMLKELEDPRAADSLYDYIQNKKPTTHWKTEAALRLAEIGDVRASEVLGWRMMQDPMVVYNKIDWPELMRDDNERVYAARMLADLAVIHPEARETLKKNAEEGVLFWIDPKNKPQPHANGLRFLAAVGSTKVLPQLKKWADPPDRLPEPGATGAFPTTWETAQSALRYYGWAAGTAAYPVLDKQLHRRTDKLDISTEGLNVGGVTILGLSIRALEYGAAQGFAQAGDPKAYNDLVKLIEDPLEHEDARKEACASLAWVATDDQMKEIVKKVREPAKVDPKNDRAVKDSTLIRTCYLETLVRKPVPSATSALIDMLGTQTTDLQFSYQIARAIGMSGISKDLIPSLWAKLKDPTTKTSAALALMLGADADTAARAVATFNDVGSEVLEELKGVYNLTFAHWSDRNYANGDIARWVENAEAIARVRVKDNMQEWARGVLTQDLVTTIEFDSGPHSMTRVRLRAALLKDAKGSNELKRDQAIAILKFMKEKGCLMALRNEPGPLGEAARVAFFEVMHPKAAVEKLPDAPQVSESRGTPNMMRR